MNEYDLSDAITETVAGALSNWVTWSPIKQWRVQFLVHVLYDMLLS